MMTTRAALLFSMFVTAGCQYVQDGWAFQPFEGPGYDIKDGLLLDIDADTPLVIAATYLPVGKDGKDLFDERMEALQGELAAGPEGLVGFSLGQKLVGREYRTVSVWESEDAMMAFVLGEAHLAAMGDSASIAEPGVDAIVHQWETTAAQLPPVWDDVIEHTDGDGRRIAY